MLKRRFVSYQVAMMTREDGSQQFNADGDDSVITLERLTCSVHEYAMPFEPVGIEDWEALDFQNDIPRRVPDFSLR